MTRLERAVVEIAAALESFTIDDMIVGGIANALTFYCDVPGTCRLAKHRLARRLGL